MKTFPDADFLLSSPTAKRLYHGYAEGVPVIDYHCHLSPREIYEDRRFENITGIWFGADHYKWRLMRAAGIDESFITGNAPDREKFRKWAATLELAIGNPLYLWSHIELSRFFGYSGVLNSDTADRVWSLCNDRLRDPSMSARGIIRHSNVRVICTTDDPADSLEWHGKLRSCGFETRILPAFRPDGALAIEKPGFGGYIGKLGETANIEIRGFRDLMSALEKRADFFDEAGCVTADHGLDYVMFSPAPEEAADAVMRARLEGKPVTDDGIAKYKTALMTALARIYHKKNWVMQLHFGALRGQNKRLLASLGSDVGGDCMQNFAPADRLAAFLGALDDERRLPKTVIYGLNPNDNAVIDAVIGCFQGGTVGKLQHGCAWWFNDHKEGITAHLKSFAAIGLLGTFIGMVTDSRSFLSYARHEYFRRVLCDLVGEWVENGEYPNDDAALEKIIKNISYNNADEYFGFEV